MLDLTPVGVSKIYRNKKPAARAGLWTGTCQAYTCMFMMS